MYDRVTESESVARTLGINPPAATSSGAEIEQWIQWWRPSAQAAAAMTPEIRASLKDGRKWPPVIARYISELAPPIVRRTLRPGLFESREGAGAVPNAN
jgi:hypothetical protein